MGFLGGLFKVVSFIPSLIIGVENIFGAKKGEEKRESVLSIVSLALNGIEGISGKDIVDNDKFNDGLKKVVEGVVQCLNASIWAKK